MKEVEINKSMKLSPHLASPSEATLSHKSELNGLRLSPHFTLGELCKTSYHTLDGNIPSRVAIENLRNICEGWLEDLRATYNKLYGESGDGSQETVDIPVTREGVTREGVTRDGVTREGQSPCASQASGEVTREGQTPCASQATHTGDSPCVSPVVITSGYRSEEVNRLAGGSANSNHLTGCAVDIRCMGPEQMIRYAAILLDIADGTRRDLTFSRVCSRSAESVQALRCARSNADFDELLLEKRGTTYWIHFAVRPDRGASADERTRNRRKILFDCR